MKLFSKFFTACPPSITPHAGWEIFRYIGPGLLVTVGFIDPGNWAANLVAGADYGYTLLWMVTLSTFMLIVLQHNAAHLGIVTGKCLAEAITAHFPRWVAVPVLLSAFGASGMTSMAEILGGAIALHMLFSIPVPVGATLVAMLSFLLLSFNSYSKAERWIIGFVSLIGLAFLYELSLIPGSWLGAAARGWVVPEFPPGSMLVIMSVLGAVVMPHNLFLHSEIIQSRQWNLQDENVIKKQLNFELFDTILAMLAGWGINSAMIILAAAVFWTAGTSVSELEQARDLLRPILGDHASLVFALALLCAGIASSVTSGMAGGIMTSGMIGETYNIKDKHSAAGVAGSLALGLVLIWMTSDPLKGLIFSQMVLSVQLPITMVALVCLTSSRKVMGKHANGLSTQLFLILLTGIVTALNIALFISSF